MVEIEITLKLKGWHYVLFIDGDYIDSAYASDYDACVSRCRELITKNNPKLLKG